MHRDHDSARAIALLEASLVGHLLLDGELRCVWLNAAAATLAGTTVEQALGRHIGEVLPQLTPSFEGVFRTVLDTALPFRQLESRVLGPGGVATDRRWIASAFPVQCAAPDLSVGVTITELARPKEVEGAAGLLEREALFRTVFERAALGMLVIDWRDHGMRLNSAFQAILGYTPEELARLGIQKITHPDDYATDLELFTRLMAGEIDHYRLPKRYLHKDGRIVWGLLGVSVARDASGSPELLISTVEDITERKLAEEERDRLLAERTRLLADAEEGVRVRDVFLAMAAHELKTPLTPLKMELDGLLVAARSAAAHDPATERTKVHLERMGRQVVRLEHLLTDLLDVVRMSTGRLQVTLERMDLAELARDLVARHREHARRAGSALELRADSPIEGAWDRGRLEQVMTNLLSNAIKFGAGKPISVAVSAEAEVARLVVKDGGPGIADELQARIFEKFERAVSERHYGGLGLGLWISRQIVQALGGGIRVESQPGAGAAFIVELPLVTG